LFQFCLLATGNGEYNVTITLYGQFCRRHVVWQQVVSYVSIVRCCWSICSLCSESNNTNLLLHLLIGVLRAIILLYITEFALQHGGVYLVTMDTEFSDVTAPYLYQLSAVSRRAAADDVLMSCMFVCV